jgi:hypothetical protein
MRLTRRRWVVLLGAAVAGVLAPGGGARSQTPLPRVATPAPPEVVAELRAAVETARRRFEARDLAGVLASVSEQYRSSGLTKAALREHLAAMLALYAEVRARVGVDDIRMVDGVPWLYTTGALSGRLPVVGWVTVLSWERQPEVARREEMIWRLYGFQD